MRQASKGAVGVVACVAVLLSSAIADAKRQRPDLVVTGLEGLPAQIAAESKFELRDTVRNKGGRKADKTRNRYFLSKNKVREPSDLKLEGSRKVPKLKHGKSSTRSVEIAVPGDATQGQYRLLACVDPGGKIREKRESNNCRASQDRIEVSNRGPGDHTAPPRPEIIGTDPAPPSADNSPRVFGVAEADSRVRIYSGDCSGRRLQVASAAAFTGVSGITVEVPANQVTSLRATATDDAGNVSDCSAGFDYDEDSTPPAAPSITGTAPPPPSSDETPTVIGMSPSPVVRVYAGPCAGGTLLATGTGAGLGAGITITVPLPEDAVTQLHANATDRAGNVSGCSAPFAYTEDSTAPEPPTITETDPASGLLTPSTDASPAVIGGAEAGSDVGIYSDAGCSASLGPMGTAAVFGGAGIPVTVTEPVTTLHASAVDAAGNESGCSADAFNYYLLVLPPP